MPVWLDGNRLKSGAINRFEIRIRKCDEWSWGYFTEFMQDSIFKITIKWETMTAKSKPLIALSCAASEESTSQRAERIFFIRISFNFISFILYSQLFIGKIKRFAVIFWASVNI